jgi:hypothetical protein
METRMSPDTKLHTQTFTDAWQKQGPRIINEHQINNQRTEGSITEKKTPTHIF